MDKISKKILIEGYCAERGNFRKEILKVDEYEKQVQTTKSSELLQSDETLTTQEKTKKIEPTMIYAFPENVKEWLEKEAAFTLRGLIKKGIKALDPYQKPPIGRYGITDALDFFTVKLTDVDVKEIKKNQHVQKHGFVGRKGSSMDEFSDTITFTAMMALATPAFGRKGVKETFEKVLECVDGQYIGPFHNAGNGKVNFV